MASLRCCDTCGTSEGVIESFGIGSFELEHVLNMRSASAIIDQCCKCKQVAIDQFIHRKRVSGVTAKFKDMQYAG